MSRRTNLALLALLACALLTGGLAYGLGGSGARTVAVAHGVAGLAVVGLAPWKTTIAGRGLRRRHLAAAVPSLALAVVVLVALLGGVLHATGTAVDLGPLTAMQLHVGAALLAVPLASWHVAVRPVVPHRTDLARRHLLKGTAVLGGAAVAYVALEGAVHLAGGRGAQRRATGSHEKGSFDPRAMPVTQWLDDSVQHIDVEHWRLVVDGRTWSYQELTAFDDGIDALLDCTGGWYARQRWTGVRLDRLLEPGPDDRSVEVRSASGYRRRFPVSDAGRLLLATSVGGRPLSAGHGFPARLVAPGRRGFWWVKWVERIESGSTPWWWQPPFPLT